jgi:adenosine deaminase
MKLERLTDLHIHLGGAVAPHILWSLAHDQGFRLPVRDYWEFYDLITIKPGEKRSLAAYLQILHEWTERIQSSPMAIERCVYEVFAKEYRSSYVTTLELRFNPMKRNSGGKMDLDHIIHAALRGLDKVSLQYGVRGGLIFCLAREFPLELNEILLDKAIRYKSRGVVGIDLAGHEEHTMELDAAKCAAYADLFRRARKAGLKTTVHTGETRNTEGEGVIAVLEKLEPDRIGHGIRAAYNPEALALLKRRGVVLEICPSSNIQTMAVEGPEELAAILARFSENKIRFTINTDGPYLLQTHLRQEFELCLREKILSEEQVETCLATAAEATFLRGS